MDLNLTIKIDDFNGAMIEMQKRLGNAVPKKKIVDYEVGRILEKALSGTDVATKASIDRSVKPREWTTMDGKKYYLKNRYSDTTWAKIENHLAVSLAQKIAAIGWARKSWYALGLAIGQPIAAKGADKASVKGRSASDNVAESRQETGGNYVLMIRNDSPLMRWTSGRQAFFAAVAGRVGFFKKNLAKGVFDDLKQVQAKYPGIKINTPPV